jgi:hypothetical protein
MRKQVLGGLALVTLNLITWWSVGVFIPLVMSHEQTPENARVLSTSGTLLFNFGAFIGCFLLIPAGVLKRLLLFKLLAFTGSLSLFVVFWIDSMSPQLRSGLLWLPGIAIYGMPFAAFTLYLPELAPTIHRARAIGFMYNAGRAVTSCFPFIIGELLGSGVPPRDIIKCVAFVPLCSLCLLFTGAVKETHGILPD